MKLLKNKFLKTKVIPNVAYFFLKGLEASCYRVQYVHADRIQEMLEQKQPIIYATWHGRMYGFSKLFNKQQVYLLISNSNDGEMVNKIAKKFGFSTIRGSMNREGAQAFRQIITTLKEGNQIAITVDGPRGPLYDVKEGVLRIAKLSGAAIIPYIPALKYQITVQSAWDQFKIPIPFSSAVCYFGEPIYVSQDADKEELKQCAVQVKEAMLAITEQVDKMAL